VKAASYKYVIVGGGLAGGFAAEGIREVDPNGDVLLIGAEAELPYDRPPLTKKLWFGQKQVSEIYPHDESWYQTHNIQLVPGTEVVHLDPEERTVVDHKGTHYSYERLLLATGGTPRRLDIAGGDLPGLHYYRYLANYRSLRKAAVEGASAAIIGGGFIGSELAAALHTNHVNVTMIYPQSHLVPRIFPVNLAYALQERYRDRGITILNGQRAAAIVKSGGRFAVRTEEGATVAADMAIAGIGIEPEVGLAREAGLEVSDGIVVNQYLETSRPGIYAAGDAARFPYLALGEMRRVEHWDNAVMQGKAAGRNLAGAGERYEHMPYFFSDLFEFGYEAVGDVDARLGTFADWQKEYDTGVIYYLNGGRVRGVMLCNIWEKVEAARELIRGGATVTPEDLRGAIQ
jgi:3-phenylpropionate/trans-cinnamate dioxygenase ferredoxin reductase subunit